jgi:phenylacetaldehyde dehydrogenase
MDTVTIDTRLSQPAKEFMHQPSRLLIDGKLVEAASGKTFPVYNPATGAILMQVAEADSADVDRAVKAARKAFDEGPWSKLSPSERGKLLWKLAELLEKHSAEFAEIESIDNGKPVAVARAADVPLAIDMFRYMGGWATKIAGSTIPLSFPGEFLSYTVREPVGVVGQIIPWNFPLLMAAWKIAPALAAGCTVVLKAAEQTPLSALRLAVHRLDRSRQADRQRRRRKPQEGFAGARRQVAGDRVSRCGSRARHPRRGDGHFLQSGSDVLRGLAVVRAQKGL